MTDSNGEDLKADLLKPGAEVRKKVRYTLTQVINFEPAVTNPEEICDVVFQVGLNDFRHGASEREILDQYYDIHLAYKKMFPNARQHVTALPPLSDEHIEMNNSFQKMCKNLRCNYISTKCFLDRTTGKLRNNLMSGFHYNQIGIRHLAKEMKKSLFSTSNLRNGPSVQ